MRKYDVIHKYKLHIDESMKIQEVGMPGYTQILSVMEQDKQIVLYCKHSLYEDASGSTVTGKFPYKFLVLGTGWEYELTDEHLQLSGEFIGTVKIDGFMWHVFRMW